MRCYDGCPDEEMRSVLEERERLKRQVGELGFRVVYFPGDAKWMVFKGWVPVSELGELEVVVEEVLKKERGFMSEPKKQAKLIKKGQGTEKAEVVVDIEVDEKKRLKQVERTVQGWFREKREKIEGSVAESRGMWDRLW